MPFNRGDKVIYVTTQERGVITDVCISHGRTMYKVYIGNQECTCTETNLMKDTDLSDPFERCKNKFFGTYLDFSKINTLHKVNNTSNNTVSSLKASKTIFKAYQFKPLLKFLNSEDRRILVADEVGLGKTIEAGHIMLEMMARGEMKNSLVICPNSLQEKWRDELASKFGFSFKIYDTLADLVRDFANNDGNIKAIINYNKIQIPKNKKKKKENEKNNKPNKKKKITIKDIIDEGRKIDFILCDEAHRLKNDNTNTYKGAEMLINTANSAVFLTATPIMISDKDLYNLLHLLDPKRYSNYSIFQNDIAVNKPFIEALSELNNNKSLPTIAKKLKTTEVRLIYKAGETDDKFYTEWTQKLKIDDLFKDNPLYKKIINDLEKGIDSTSLRVQLQFDISSMSSMNNIFSRTRKIEVTNDMSQAKRQPHKLTVDLNREERKKFDEVINQYTDDNSYIDEWGEIRMSRGKALGLVQKKRRVASSVYGYLNSEQDLNDGIDKYRDREDAKFNELLKIIEEIVGKNKKKLIVFALFKKTLKYLDIRLKQKGYETLMINGEIQDRENIIQQFHFDSNISILLSSEVGGEGLDMQFCDSLVNYDLPWNPMVVEQRIGRIDRFGQKSAVVNIYNMVVKNSIQDIIYERLLVRIGLFRSCIGDLEAILNTDEDIQQRLSNLERELYCTRLTEAEREKKIDNVQRAIETEKKNLETIKEGLTDALTNDMYFKDEIKRIENNNRYVTEQELINYVKTIIRYELKTCRLEKDDCNSGYFKFIIPDAEKMALINFLTENQPEGADNEVVFRRFINKIRGQKELILTFNQEHAYDNISVIFINMYNPIVLATTEYLKKQNNSNNTTFEFSVCRSKFNHNIDTGLYYLGIYSIEIEKNMLGKVQIFELLVPVLYDTKNDKFLDKDISEEFFGVAQLYADKIDGFINASISYDDLRMNFTGEKEKIEKNFIEDQRMRLESTKERQKQRTIEYYDNMIQRQSRIVKKSEETVSNILLNVQTRTNTKKILPVQKNRLEELQNEKNSALQNLDNSKISFKIAKLLSLSQISVK